MCGFWGDFLVGWIVDLMLFIDFLLKFVNDWVWIVLLFFGGKIFVISEYNFFLFFGCCFFVFVMFFRFGDRCNKGSNLL